MISIILALLCGLVLAGLSALVLDSTGWHVLFFVIGFIACSVLLARHFGQRLKLLVEQVQATLQAAQEDAMRWLNRFQAKPMGSQKLMQDRIEEVMAKGVREALVLLDGAKPMFKWNITAERQINTLRFQLLYQLKEFDEADKLLDKIFVLEPITLAMKMARLYKRDDPRLEKVYRKGVKRFKYEKAKLIYSLYAWILLQREQYEQATAVLDEAKTKTEDETIARNWQNVANKKYTAFSNAGLGDEWYALHLEKPAKPRVSKGQTRNNPLMPRGKRRYF